MSDVLAAVCQSWITGALFLGPFGPRKGPKLVISQVLGHFLKKVLLCDPETIFTGR